MRCNGFVTVTCGYKIRDFSQTESNSSMRLDELLVSVKDLFPMVAENLDAVSLFRLGAVCKDMRKCRKQSEVLRACVLRTFPGIRGVPGDEDVMGFEIVFRCHFGGYLPVRGPFPYLELVTLVGNRIKYSAPSGSMEVRVMDLFSNIQPQFWSFRGRKSLIKCVREWRYVVGRPSEHFVYRDDALEMLDRMVYIAKHNFQWESCFRIGYYY